LSSPYIQIIFISKQIKLQINIFDPLQMNHVRIAAQKSCP